MAVKSKEIEEVIGDDFRPEEDRIADVVLDLQEQIEGGGGIIRANLYRIHPVTGDRIYLANVPAETFTLDLLRDQYGGGDYAVSLAVKGRKGIPPRNWKVSIEAPVGWVSPQARPVPVAVESPPATSTPLVDPLREQLRADRARMDGLMEAMLRNMRPPDPAEQMQLMMQSFSAFQSMLPKAAAVAPPVDGLAQAARLLTLIRENTPVKAGEATSSDVLLAAIQGLTPVLRDAVAAQQGAALQAPAPVAVEPTIAPVPVPVKEKPEQPELEEDGEMSDIAEQMFLAQMVATAEAGGDQRAWVRPVLAVVDPEEAREFLAGPDALEELVQINPAVRKHEAWFKRMGEVLVEYLDRQSGSPVQEVYPVPEVRNG